MRGNTQVVLAARNVGDSNDQGQIFEGSADDALRFIIKMFAATTMARRIDIAVGRDLAEVSERVMGSKINKQIAEDDLMSEMEQLMSLPKDDEDDYVGPT